MLSAPLFTFAVLGFVIIMGRVSIKVLQNLSLDKS